MLPSDIRSMQEAYRNVYEESDFLTDDLIEEIVEELVEECVEFGYTLEESVAAVEEAAILYIDEAKVTYGSDTESPEQRSARAKDRLGDRKASARKAAVTNAVSKVKSKAAGAAVSGYVAAKAAKSAVSGAVNAAKRVPGAVSAAAKQKKAEVKGGIKRMIGGGLRAAAGGLGKIAQKASGAASRLGEAKDDSYLETNMKKREKNNNDAINSMRKTDAHKSMAATAAKKFDEEVEQIDEISNELVGRAVNKRIAQSGAAHNAEMRNRTPETARASARSGEKEASMKIAAARRKERVAEESNEEVEIYDVVLEYLMTEGHADTIAEAEYIMTELDSEMVNQILETRFDPRGRPASGPMNVYANPKRKPDQAHLDAVKAYDDKQKKKTPEQRKAELDAYIARQRNK